MAGFPYSLYAPVMRFRDASMAYLCDGIGSAEAKGFMAGVFFGCRQGVSRESTDTFIKTGTVHILSISGLHVGIIALLATWLLRWVPFTTRYLSLPPIILLYVLATGASAPAMRAFLMISVWCLHKAFLYPARPVNAVALAALIILAFNPFMVNDIGFQFSFIVTTYLVLSWDMARNWTNAAFEARRWTPPGSMGWLGRLRDSTGRKLIADTVCSMVAFLACVGLTVVYQGVFIPASFIVNFFLLPLMFPLFTLVAAKIVLYPVMCWPLGVALNASIEKLIEISFSIVDLGSKWTGLEHLSTPSALGLVVFHAALLGFCLAKNRTWSIGSLATMAALIGWWYSAGLSEPERMIVFQGDSPRQFAIAIRPATGHAATLVDCPKRLSRIIREKLVRSGAASIDYLCLTGAGVDSAGGVVELASWLPVSTLALPKKHNLGKSCREAVERCSQSGSALSVCVNKSSGVGVASGNFSYQNKGSSRYDMSWESGSIEYSVAIVEERPGVRRVTVTKKGGKPKSVLFANSNRLKVSEIRF